MSWSLDEARLEVGEERSSDSLSELCELEEEVVDSTDADTCAIAGRAQLQRCSCGWGFVHGADDRSFLPAGRSSGLDG